MQHVQDIPAEIITAICQVKSTMQTIPKNGFNRYGQYKFATADDVYAAVIKRMAEAGLVILTLEVSTETRDGAPDDKGRPTKWLRACYQFVLAAEGKTWTDKSCVRTEFAQITGPQSFAAVQSYAEKQFFRSLFKLATGDMDLDAVYQAPTEEEAAALNKPAGKRKSSSRAKKDGDQDLFNEIMANVEAAVSPESLQTIYSDYKAQWDEMPNGWVELLNDAYHYRMKDLGGGLI